MRMDNITVLISCFQWEEYGARGGSPWQGRVMKRFNRYLAEHSDLPATVRKRWANVDAPISALKASHFRDFLWSIDREAATEAGEGPYVPTLKKFVDWLKGRGDITEAQYEAMLDVLSELRDSPEMTGSA